MLLHQPVITGQSEVPVVAGRRAAATPSCGVQPLPFCRRLASWRARPNLPDLRRSAANLAAQLTRRVIRDTFLIYTRGRLILQPREVRRIATTDVQRPRAIEGIAPSFRPHGLPAPAPCRTGPFAALPAVAMPNSARVRRAGIVIADRTGGMIAARPAAAMPAAECPDVASVKQAG